MRTYACMYMFVGLHVLTCTYGGGPFVRAVSLLHRVKIQNWCASHLPSKIGVAFPSLGKNITFWALSDVSDVFERFPMFSNAFGRF